MGIGKRSKMKNEDCTDNIDWEEQTLQTVMDAANFGDPNAMNELEKRRREMDKLGTVTPKFSIQDDED
jgi:hypothetical protein